MTASREERVATAEARFLAMRRRRYSGGPAFTGSELVWLCRMRKAGLLPPPGAYTAACNAWAVMTPDERARFLSEEAPPRSS